jgi:Putative adhesin
MSRYMMSRFTLSTLAAAALVLAAFAPRAGAQDEEHGRNRGRHAQLRDADETTTIDTTIAFAATGGVADLSLMSGKITVTAWTRPEARVHVTSDHVPVRFEHESGRLLLDSRGYRHRRGDDDGDDDGDNDVEYTVTVPTGTRVILHSISGDLEVQGTRGELEARSVSGDIRADDVARNATLESLSGNMTVHNDRGDLHMRTVSGDGEADVVTGDVTFTSVSGHGYVTHAASRNLHMESVSGDLTYGGTLDPSGTYDLHAHSGDVHLDLPADASATVSLDSFSGEITSDFPITIQPRGETGPAAQHLDATLGKGGARITVVTFSGDIELRSGTPHKR